MALLDDISTYLGNEGVATFGTDMFAGHMPDSPDGLICLYEYGGTVHSDWTGEEPRLQVVTRDTSYEDARSKLTSVFAKLHDERELTVNGNRYLYIEAQSTAELMGVDEKRRYRLVQNYRVVKER